MFCLVMRNSDHPFYIKSHVNLKRQNLGIEIWGSYIVFGNFAVFLSVHYKNVKKMIPSQKTIPKFRTTVNFLPISILTQNFCGGKHENLHQIIPSLFARNSTFVTLLFHFLRPPNLCLKFKHHLPLSATENLSLLLLMSTQQQQQSNKIGVSQWRWYHRRRTNGTKMRRRNKKCHNRTCHRRHSKT